MKNIYITDFKTGEEIESFFMVKSIAVKMGSNKRNYMDILLGDNTGEIYAKKWNLADEEMDSAKFIAEGEVIKIRAEVTEWNSMKQLKISRIRKTNKDDDIQMSDYIKAAPEPPEEMYAFIKGKAQAMEDGNLKALCLMNLGDNQEKLLYYPAAQKNHHAEMAGLLWHIKRMIMTAEGVCLVYPHLDKDMVIAGVILHDMQKLYEINANEQGISGGYSFEGMLLGHLVMGIKVLDRQMESLSFPREKSIMVEHMILSHHYEPEFGSPKKPLFPEAELLHYLDMIDAKMYDMEDALAKTEPGGFSERVWTLDNRRLYKKQEEQK